MIGTQYTLFLMLRWWPMSHLLIMVARRSSQWCLAATVTGYSFTDTESHVQSREKKVNQFAFP